MQAVEPNIVDETTYKPPSPSFPNFSLSLSFLFLRLLRESYFIFIFFKHGHTNNKKENIKLNVVHFFYMLINSISPLLVITNCL